MGWKNTQTQRICWKEWRYVHRMWTWPESLKLQTKLTRPEYGPGFRPLKSACIWAWDPWRWQLMRRRNMILRAWLHASFWLEPWGNVRTDVILDTLPLCLRWAATTTLIASWDELLELSWAMPLLNRWWQWDWQLTTLTHLILIWTWGIACDQSKFSDMNELNWMWVCQRWSWGLRSLTVSLSSSWCAWHLNHQLPLMLTLKLNLWCPKHWCAYPRLWSFYRFWAPWCLDEIHLEIWEELPCEDDCLEWFWWLSQWVWLADAAWSPRWSLKDTSWDRNRIGWTDSWYNTCWIMNDEVVCEKVNISVSADQIWCDEKNWWSLTFLNMTSFSYDIESLSMTILRILALTSSVISGMSWTLPRSVPE